MPYAWVDRTVARPTVMLNRYWLGNTWPLQGTFPADIGLPRPTKGDSPGTGGQTKL
ncbi:hypothetical protein KW849_08830 [Pseudomonas sp. PDM26]|uniref:hypothetical protein n=1 Tax=Pseudomonas sp. PDM26 TaxID=2854766 RepID=UPI001C480DA7|nr:hypothetical protein [Pseudomonas sp. PDM26]MBV7546397.1 hypothetical protein [Pseudomonas sp. PDM26]